jgi:hypothetical protein
MARYNTVSKIVTISGATTLTYVLNGGTFLLTGSSGYTVGLVNPTLYSGTTQTFYNKTSGNVTLSTGTNSIVGLGFTTASTQIIPAGTTYTLTSDGTNYIITNNQGGPVYGTTGFFSSSITACPASANIVLCPTGTGTITLNSGTTGAIVNMTIGATGTANTGTFSTMTATTATITGGTVSTTPSNSTDLANKLYVDTKASKINAAGYYYGSLS